MTLKTTSVGIGNRAGTSWQRWAAGALLLLATALLLGYDLVGWPAIWRDEGNTLQVSRNLSELGRYGILSSDGFRAFSPISTGPTVSVPIALVFAAVGPGLLQARMVVVAYALLAVLLLYVLALRLFDLRTAVIAGFLFISAGAASGDTSASFVGLGRMVMGEVPGLAFLLAGTLLWSAGLDSDRLLPTFAAGLLWGLAMVTKPQFIFIVAGLLLTWVVYALRQRQVCWLHCAIPLLVSLACAGAWLAWQYYSSGPTQQAEIAGRFGAQISILFPRLIVKSFRVLLSQREVVWGLPALFYGLYLTLTWRRPAHIWPSLFLIFTCVIWLSWFVLGSIGWGRYAFPPFAIMALFSGKLLADLLGQVRWPFSRSHAEGAGEPAQGTAVRSVAVLVAIVLLVAGSLQSAGRDILRARDDTALAFAQYLDRSLPPHVVIECFEPEIVFLSRGDLRFHQPPFSVETLAIRHAQLGVPYPDGSYDLRAHGATYLIAGPFSRWTALYEQELQSGSLVLIETIGAYDLYHISSGEGE